MTHRWITFAAAITLAACSKPEAAPKSAGAGPVETPVKVQTAPIEIRKMPKYLTLIGSVLADRSSEVAANVAGQVTATYVERGQPVKAGQVIAIVDSKAVGFQVAAAVAQQKAAESQVELAKQDCARADQLFSQGAIAKAEYERQKTQCSAQLYNANAVQAQADLAGKLAGDTQIKSPMNGVIGERYVNLGEYVQPASRVASVYSVNPVRVSISVPESAVGKVKEGQLLEIRVAAHPDRAFPAVVRLLGPALRPATRDLIVEAFAANEDRLLMPGMFATVQLIVGEEDLPTVPTEAIKVDGTVRRLFLARNGSAFEMVVRTGVEQNGKTSVHEPLSNEDKVILNPPPGLHDGSVLE